MTIFNVHIYREMRLFFPGIEADSHEAAAEIVGCKPTSNADTVSDCEGQNMAALVDVAGDEDYSQSVTIDFEPERQRLAAPKLLAALESALEFLKANDDGEEDIRSRIAAATTAIAEAEAAGIKPEPSCPGVPEVDVHALLARQRQIAVIWSIEDAKEVRPHLSDDQAWDVLQHARRYHDASIGINWDVLRCHADHIAHSAGESGDAGSQP